MYAIGAGVAFKVSAALVENRHLPDWFIIGSIILLIVGLLIVITTVLVQRGIPALGRSDPTLRVDVEGDDPGEERVVYRPTGAQRIFTWRNAILGGVAAFTLWAIIAAGWLILIGDILDNIQNSAVQDSVVQEQPVQGRE